jgi:cell division protein FtsB
MARKNRKIRREGKVIIPDLMANLSYRASHLPLRQRRLLVNGIKLAVLAVVVYAFAAGPGGFMRLRDLYAEQNALQAEDCRLSVEIVQLDNIRQSLETDTSYIEKIAREDYGYSRPDEIIYFEPEPKKKR